MKTYAAYKQIVEKRLKPRLGEYELNEISPVILQCYVTELLQQGNSITGTGLSANTVNGIITVIQNSLKLACMIGESEKYIADKIKRPKTSEKEVSCFTAAEQKKIERAVLAESWRFSESGGGVYAFAEEARNANLLEILRRMQYKSVKKALTLRLKHSRIGQNCFYISAILSIAFYLTEQAFLLYN